MTDDLTERQTAILSFISRHCRDTGYPPTVREIGLAVGLASPSTVHAHLAKLEAARAHQARPDQAARDVVRVPDAEAAAPRGPRSPPCR